MKTTITLLFLTFLGSSFGFTTNYPTKQVQKYERIQQQTIALPTDFAKAFIIHQKDINHLAGKTIHHIELVYTQYAESPNFNQQALNAQRISQLKKVLPQINKDQPSWTGIEQTGATTRDAANDYFHGFVIHYGEKIDHKELGLFLSELSGKSKEFTITNADGGTFTHSSGSVIHVPSNAVTYKDGRRVAGNFTLSYKEFRDPAEIALSGLPMYYKGDNFSSVGMYEIRGSKDGEELKLLKPITVDFNCTKVVDDASFFTMTDANGEWKKEFDLNFNEGQQAAVSVPPLKKLEVVQFVDLSSMQINWVPIDKKTGRATLDLNAWTNYKTFAKNDQPLGIISIDSANRSFVVALNKRDEFEAKIFQRDHFIAGQMRVPNHPINRNPQPNQMSATLLAEGSKDPGHTYPTIVKGLNSPNFGVYNCDQVYRIGEAAYLSPVYMDASTGKIVEDGFVACVMDLSYNGSFSFHPNNLTLNKKGKNAILLFTKDKEIYIIESGDLAKVLLSDDQTVKLMMRNVTAELKSPTDLKNLLNI